MYRLVGGWVGIWVGSCQITKNKINLELIDIFLFCVKIYDLWRLCHPYTYPPSGVSQQLKFWVSSIVQQFDFLTINVLCITANFGHSFDILTFDFLLKPPQRSTWLFFLCYELTSFICSANSCIFLFKRLKCDNVFQLFPVNITTLLELLKAIELNDGHRYIPELWTGVILSTIIKRFAKCIL